MRFLKRKQLGRLATATVLIPAAFFSAQAAMACSVDNWSGGTVGTLNAAQPNDVTNAAARYSGACALEIAGDQTAFVQDNSPAGIERIIARFYLLADNSSNAVVYRGRGDGGSTLFQVVLAANGTVTASSGAGSATGTAIPGEWNSFEIDWSSGTGIELIVNGIDGGASGSSNTSAAGMLQNVRLGNINGASGTLSFDAYESRRTTAIGRLVVADANASGDVTGGDLSVIASEILGNGLALGQPDCNESGEVTGADLSCTAAIILGL